MKIFKHITEDIIVVTNYKVMFSSLATHSSLIEISNRRLLYYILKEKTFLKKNSKKFLLFRHPLKRLISFHKNKFAEISQLKEYDKWEHCQKIFFSFLNITKHDSPAEIMTTIKAFSFSEFIQLLDSVYQLDAHLSPQYFALQVKSLLGIRMNVEYDKLFDIDNPNHISKLEQTLNINFHKSNASKPVHGLATVSPELNSIIESIYHEDLKIYYSTLCN